MPLAGAVSAAPRRREHVGERLERDAHAGCCAAPRLLRETGARHGKSPAQIALRWLIDNGALPIPGAKNGAQASHNAGALGFSLSAAERDALDQATRAWRR